LNFDINKNQNDKVRTV